MRNEFRFGKRIVLPSTRQIKHELRMMIAAESIANLQRELQALSNTTTTESLDLDNQLDANGVRRTK